jgi:hypothetical protein
MTGVGWYSQQISLNFLNLVKFYICKPKSTGRGSLIKKQTIQVIHERGTSEFLFCRNQQYLWQ